MGRSIKQVQVLNSIVGEDRFILNSSSRTNIEQYVVKDPREIALEESCDRLMEAFAALCWERNLPNKDKRTFELLYRSYRPLTKLVESFLHRWKRTEQYVSNAIPYDWEKVIDWAEKTDLILDSIEFLPLEQKIEYTRRKQKMSIVGAAKTATLMNNAKKVFNTTSVVEVLQKAALIVAFADEEDEDAEGVQVAMALIASTEKAMPESLLTEVGETLEAFASIRKKRHKDWVKNPRL